jgi:hypothetical protein
MIFIAIIIVIGAAVLVVSSIQRPPSGPVCDQKIVQLSLSYFEHNNPSQLNKLSSQITGLQNYRSDSNCMYILSMDNLKVLNAPKAQADFNQLSKDVASGKKINPILLKYESISVLHQNILNIYNVYQNNLHNSIILSPVPPKVK